MPVLFDTDSYRLRLDRDSFRALVAWRSGQHGEATGLDRLRAAGVVQPDDRLHPALQPGLDAVLNPICRLVIRMRDGQGGAERGDSWVGGDATALLLDLPNGLCEFGTVHPSFLPAMLARILELGPRPRLAGEPVQATPELLDQLTDPDPVRRDSAARPLGHDSLAELHRDWQIQASWQPGGGSAGVRALRVLDTAAGLWLVEPHTDRAVLFPTSPSAVWLELVRLLPTDQELSHR